MKHVENLRSIDPDDLFAADYKKLMNASDCLEALETTLRLIVNSRRNGRELAAAQLVAMNAD